MINVYTTLKKLRICQYLDLNTKIKANSRNRTKHLENFKISLTFLCIVYTCADKCWKVTIGARLLC